MLLIETNWIPASAGMTVIYFKNSLVILAAGSHLIPSRTQKLSSPAPMVLVPYGTGRVGRRRRFFEVKKNLKLKVDVEHLFFC